MKTRRTFFRILTAVTGGAVLSGIPITNLKANRDIQSFKKSGNQQMKIVVAGYFDSRNDYYLHLMSQPDNFDIVAFIDLSANKEISNTFTRSAFVFASYSSFFRSNIEADAILFTGEKMVLKQAEYAISKGMHVWSDRPFSLCPSTCKNLNYHASSHFCKINIAYVIDDKLCFMENKTYSADI